LVLIFLVSLIQNTLGHGWLNYPIPRGYAGDTTDSASNSGPCGLGTDGVYLSNVTVTVQANDIINAQYNLGGGHDNGGGLQMCRFSLAMVDTSQVNFDQNILATGIPCTAGQDQTAQVPILIDTPGMYILQFHWFAGDSSNWYNCAMLNVTQGPDIQLYTTTTDTLVTRSIDSPSAPNGSVNVYNAVTLPTIIDAFQHIVVKFNGTNTAGLVNLTSSMLLPASYYSGSYKQVQAYMQSITLCSVPQQAKQIYVGLFPDQSYVGNVSFMVNVYEGELNFNTRPTISFVAGKGDYYYFRSQSYSEPTSGRRVVVEGRGGYAYLSGPFNDCNEDDKIVTQQNYCIDLPLIENGKENNPTVYYYGVFFDDSYNGKVMLEKGKCSAYSGVSTLVASILSLLAFLLI